MTGECATAGRGGRMDDGQRAGGDLRDRGWRRLARVLLIGAGALGCLLAPSFASASTLTGGPNPKITASNGEQNQIVLSGTASGTVITDAAGIALASAPECTQDTPNQVTCNSATGNWQFLRLALGDLDDRIDVQSFAPGWGVDANGEGGNDRLDFGGLAGLPPIGPGGGQTTADARGGAGNDVLIGSQGSNVFDSDSSNNPDPNYDVGDDTLIGGPLRDRLGGGRGSDSMDGRDGSDTLLGILIDAENDALQEDGGRDTMSCGPGYEPLEDVADVVFTGKGDTITTDCELLAWPDFCPAGGTCVGTKSATTTVKRKGKKRKIVLARRSVKGVGGRDTGAALELKGKAVRSALGKRDSMPATVTMDYDRIKGGKKIGSINRSGSFRIARAD